MAEPRRARSIITVREESSLADVDNEIAAVVRKFMKPVSRANTIIAPRPEAHT